MRIKRGIVSHRKHKKLLAATSGYRMTKRRLVKVAREAALHAGQYAYAGRRIKKSDMRKLWIIRISEAVKKEGTSYSVFMNKLKKGKILLDRKILSDLLLNDNETFKAVIDKARSV